MQGQINKRSNVAKTSDLAFTDIISVRPQTTVGQQNDRKLDEFEAQDRADFNRNANYMILRDHTRKAILNSKIHGLPNILRGL